jgi:single-stranded-DNA-specific exonuclease
MSNGSRPIRRRAVPEIPVQLSGLHPVLQRIYAARGVLDPGELDYGLAGLEPVGSLEGIDEAVELLLAHRQRKILVVGDFDADGATSTALVIRCLRAFDFGQVDYLVPNRFDYGYGLTPEIVEVAASGKPDLLITVDNGISSLKGVALANTLGMQVLVTDHHLPGPELPDAAAIVNPNLKDSAFPGKNLAGVGVAFYLMAALGRRLQDDGRQGAAKVPARFLDLVALGTVADVVKLDRNNRILVTQGLQRIRSGQSVAGIRALLEVAGKTQAKATSGDLGFIVGPRLNAAGRLEDMALGIECLLTDDLSTASQLAARLNNINLERREIEAKMRDEAFAYMDSMPSREWPSCVCVYEPSWHQGVVGLIASKVRERCHRPVIAFAEERPGMLKGSARSVQGVHIRDLLERIATEHPGLVTKFGGHAMAAGLSLATADYDRFAAASSKALLDMYPNADYSGAILSDGALPAQDLSLDFAQQLRQAGPWGAGFPEPLFNGDFVVTERRVVGERHLKLRVKSTQGGAVLDAIAFNQADEGSAYRGYVQLAYRLDVNDYRGWESAQLIVEQIVAIAC